MLNGGEEHGNPRPGMIVHKLGDRYMAMQIVGAPRLWQRLLGIMKRPELAKDPRFTTAITRRRHWRELRSVITGWLDTFPSTDAALAVLTAARIPCAPVLRPAEVIATEHLATRGFFPVLPHPGLPSLRVTASPYHLGRAPHPPPGPGCLPRGPAHARGAAATCSATRTRGSRSSSRRAPSRVRSELPARMNYRPA